MLHITLYLSTMNITKHSQQSGQKISQIIIYCFVENGEKIKTTVLCGTHWSMMMDKDLACQHTIQLHIKKNKIHWELTKQAIVFGIYMLHTIF